MKTIVHIMIAAAYREGHGYQENIMPKKHKQLGYNVAILTYDQGWNPSYKTMEDEGVYAYINNDDIPVYILRKRRYGFLGKVKGVRALFSNLSKRTIGLYDKLKEISPDIIFVHCVVCQDHYDVIRYVKEFPHVRLYVDNHNDYYNTDVHSVKGKIIMRYVGRRIAKELASVATHFWGVSPWRVRFLNEVLGVPKEKIGLLVMGGDDDLIKWNCRQDIRSEIRQKHMIPNDAFLLITGGKIDKAKNIHLLIDAVKRMPENVYLLIFGKYESDMKLYEKEIDNRRIVNVGWIPSNKSYDYFLSSDMAVFPGTHSVLWEQSCASGLAAIFKDWNGGFSHVDVGGNCVLLKDVTVDNLYNSIIGIVNDKERFEQMKNMAEHHARYVFSYYDISKRAIEHNKYK